MVSTCGLSRLLTGAALGYIGAGPFHSSLANWFGAGVGVGAVWAWRRWISRSTACAMVPPSSQSGDESDDESSHTPATPRS